MIKNAMICLMFLLTLGCGARQFSGKIVPAPQPFLSPDLPVTPPIVDVPTPTLQEDDSVVRGVAMYTVELEQDTAFHKFINNLFSFPKAWAVSTATTTVTYNNAANVSFVVNVASFVAGSFTGDTLNLGSFTITTLKDNNLKVCNPGGNTKCTQAILRVYNTGAVAGFVNTSDSPQYGAPVYTSGDNPAVASVLSSPGTEVTQVTGMPSNKHTVKLADFPLSTFQVTSDFSNAGSGSYSMVFVVEYALAP